MNVYRKQGRLLPPLLLAAVMLASCATAPEQPAEPQQPQAAAPAAPLPEQEYSKAKALKARVDGNGLGELVPQEYRQAESSFQEAQQLYGKDNSGAKAALEAAVQAYTVVIDKGFPLKIAPLRAEAEKGRADAEELKAQVAAKDLYAEALDSYRQAVAAEDAGEYEKALQLFAEARRRFDQLLAATREKKAAAEAALQATDKGLADSQRQGREADSEIGSGR